MEAAVQAGAFAPASGGGDAPTGRLLLPSGAPMEEWHAVRRAGIGGIDVAAILGLDRYRGPMHVYEAKHGRTERETRPMKWGRRLESVIAEAFTEEAGLATALTPGTLQHREVPWMLANVDRYVLDEHAAVVAPLECKNRSEHQAADWEEDVPDGPALQAHWYMAVGGWSHAWVAALVGGNRLYWHRLERDEELIAHLVDYLGAWWQRHVVGGFPPPADGSQATTDLLAHLWDVKPAAIVQVDPVRAVELRERRAKLKARLREMEYELGAVENEMRMATGGAEIARVGTQTAWTWKANGTFRSAAFCDERPDLAAEYVRSVKAVDTHRLAADHPDIYRKYRARRLVAPAKGL